MFKKLISIILILSVCLSVSSCKYRRSSKPYLDYNDGFADGYIYRTERKQTDTFIAFVSRSGKTLLFPMNEEKYNAYDPDGLCKVEPGKAYSITYDVQYKSGGIGGDYEAFFLAVYDWKEVPLDDSLFEKGFAKSVNGPVYLFDHFGYYIDTDYVVLLSDDGGYDIYKKEYGKRHYEELREVRFPLSVNDLDSPIMMQFNVFCNRSLTDEYIIDSLCNGKENNGEFVFLHAFYPGNNYSVESYDSILKAAVEDRYQDNILYIYSDNAPKERTRRIIKRKDLAVKSAEELGLDQDVYEKIYNKSLGMRIVDRNKVQSERNGKLYHYDVLLFGGELSEFVSLTYGSDLKLVLDDSAYTRSNPDERSYQYIAIFVRSEFVDLIPQD